MNSIILDRTATCPAWCTAHEPQIHNTLGHVPGFSINMNQVGAGGDDADLVEQAEPTIWVNDEPLSLDVATVLVAVLSNLLAEAKAAAVVDVSAHEVRLPSPRASVVPADAGSAALTVLLSGLVLLFAVLGAVALAGVSGPLAAVLLALAPVFIVGAAAVAGSGRGRHQGWELSPTRRGRPLPRGKRTHLSEAGNTTIGLVIAASFVAAPIPFAIDFVAKAVQR